MNGDVERRAALDLHDYYEDALQNKHIKKPLSWALYMTWQKWNQLEQPRRGNNEPETD